MVNRGLEELYAAHAGPSTRLAYLLTGDHQLAQDIAQDAFIRAAGRFQHLRQPSAFGPYLNRVVINLVRDHFRKKAVEIRWLNRERGAAEEGIADNDPTDRYSLMGALAQLPERQRAAVVLRYYEDMTERQVADAMNVSHRAARSLISRGMGTLRNLMEGDVDD